MNAAGTLLLPRTNENPDFGSGSVYLKMKGIYFDARLENLGDALDH